MPKHPGLVQWLALADAKQCAPLVHTCLSQLLRDGGSTDAIYEALASPHLRKLVEELRPETKAEIMLKLVGLPFGFQVTSVQYSTLEHGIFRFCTAVGRGRRPAWQHCKQLI